MNVNLCAADLSVDQNPDNVKIMFVKLLI